MIKPINLGKLLNNPISLSEKFHQKTKLKQLINLLPLNSWPVSWKKIYYKSYARLEEIELPEPSLDGKISLKRALTQRKSIRSFSNRMLSKNKISTLLYFSSGLIKANSKLPRRFYPSAGARYPLEVYLISINSELPRGLYHYYIKSNSLEKLLTFNRFDFDRYYNQKWIKRSSCLIIITAIFERTTIKYGDRGYRFILMEAGHLAQNINLISSALNISCCAIGGYIDDNINKLIDLDGVRESVINVIGIG